MGQIVSAAAKPKRCNANQLSQVPTPAAGEYILVSSDNSMNAAGQGHFDSYIIGDGTTAASALPLHKFKAEELDEQINGSEVESALTLTGTELVVYKNGTTEESPYWNTSQDISLSKGDTIKLTAYGSMLAAAISIKANNTYTMCEGCTWPSASKTEASFSYTATNDCVVVLCYRVGTGNPYSASVIRLSGGLVGDIEKKVDDVATADEKTYGRKKGEWVEIDLSAVTDKTLTQSDEAADAKVVGDILNGEPAETEFHSIEIQVISGSSIDKNGDEYTGGLYNSRTTSYLLKKGDTIRLNGAGTLALCGIARVNSNNTFTPLVIYEGTTASAQQLDYQATEDCYVTLSFRSSSPWTYAFSLKRGATVGLIDDVEDLKGDFADLEDAISDLSAVKKTIVEVGTGKTYTSLITAIENMADSSESNQYEIHLFAGTYDTVDTSLIVDGGDYKGLEIPDYVSIIGIGNRDDIIIRGQVSAEVAGQYTSATINKISALNMMQNGNLENVTLYAKNLRYCNHNDGTHTTFAKQVFKDVAFVYDVLEITGVTANCNGIGNECGKDILFDHCVFDNKTNNGGGVFMHDNASASEKQGARLEIRNCIFKGAGIALSNSGGSYECYAIITNNKIGKGVSVTSANSSITTNQWKVIASSNYNFVVTQSSGMSGVDLSNDITVFCNQSPV